MAAKLRRSLFDIPRMDCPSEERTIRLALGDVQGIAGLSFDLAARSLVVEHEGDEGAILGRLKPLGFGAQLRESTSIEEVTSTTANADPSREASVLKVLLAINAAMFFAELGVGLAAKSSGLVADSLDMFADASVYGLSLYAVGRGSSEQKRAARWSGWLQLVLAGIALVDVLRRAAVGSEPVPALMMSMAVLALVANAACMVLLFKHRQGGVHMKASWIFSGTDVIANAGVIVAGAAVAFVGSAWPDLVVGLLIALVVFRGGLRILRLTRTPPAGSK